MSRSPRVHWRVHNRPPLFHTLSKVKAAHFLHISLKPVLILSTNLRVRLPSGSLFEDFPTKTLYAFTFTIHATCLAHLVLLHWNDNRTQMAAGRLQLKCDGTRWRKGGEVKGKLVEWVLSTLHTTSEHGVSSITTADAHTSAASSRLN